jgi:uncharacterized protein YecT (DUF1311 family)
MNTASFRPELRQSVRIEFGDDEPGLEGYSVRQFLTFVLLVFFGFRPLLGQNSERYSACLSNASTQAAMRACASGEAERVDAELNSIYQRLLLKAGGRPAIVEKIRALQRAWAAYRDAYIEATYPAEDKQTAYGSIFPMEADLLRAKLTRQHIEALKDLLKQHDSIQ